jgi:DNA-binding GntR family transcriptional regulator
MGGMNRKRSSARNEVRDLIVSRILDGSYPPGTRLKELALAHECGVSQGPVREALRELETLGLLESEHYRGTRVRGADAAELREAYELRALLEERSAQLAVPCSAETIALLKTELEHLRGAVRRRNLEANAEAVVRFHRKIVEASGNRAFLNAWDALHWEVRTRIAVQRVWRAGVDTQSFVKAHDAILKSLRTGNGRRAGRLIRELIYRLLEVVAPKVKLRPQLSGSSPRSPRATARR